MKHKSEFNGDGVWSSQTFLPYMLVGETRSEQGWFEPGAARGPDN